MLGNSKDRYPVNSIIRYQCDSGFTQRHISVVRCLPDGQWEEPKVECIGGKYTPHTLDGKVTMLCSVRSNNETMCQRYHLPQQAKQSTGYGKDPSRHVLKQSVVERGGKSSKQDNNKNHTSKHPEDCY